MFYLRLIAHPTSLRYFLFLILNYVLCIHYAAKKFRHFCVRFLLYEILLHGKSRIYPHFHAFFIFFTYKPLLFCILFDFIFYFFP